MKVMTTMSESYKCLTETPMFEKVETTEGVYVLIPAGLVYGDQTNIDFELIKRNGTNILTDNGRTLAYLDKIFELTEPDVIKNIRAATEHYGISMKRQRMALEIETIEDFPEGYLKMLFCVDFTESMKIFYV